MSRGNLFVQRVTSICTSNPDSRIVGWHPTDITPEPEMCPSDVTIILIHVDQHIRLRSIDITGIAHDEIFREYFTID